MEDKFDRQRYERSVSALYRIFGMISDTTTEVSRWRCPYKNSLNQCTAEFRCRNQYHDTLHGNRFSCAGDDKLDYHSAWEAQVNVACYGSTHE